MSGTPLCQSHNASSVLSTSLLDDGLLQVAMVLVDSDAGRSFIDVELTSQLYLPAISLQDPLEAFAITGALLICITHVTSLVCLLSSGNFREEIIF